MKRWLAIAAMVVGLLGVMMAPAHADPTNAPGAVPLTVTCDGTSYPAVGVPGHGRWAPALITTTNAVLVPFGFAFTVTNLTTGEVIFRDAFSKEPAERNPTTTTCTYQGDFTDEEGNIIRVQGTVDVVGHPLG